MRQRSTFLFTTLAFGYAFLYLPIVILMVYSFNDSRIQSVWNGFSLRWYASLLENVQIIDAALLSLQIAIISATIATVLGTLAGLSMTHMGRFKGRLLFTGLIAAPLIMPEVITGLSLLLVFVSTEQWIGWPENRGTVTIIIAHITFSMAFVAVIVQSRLSTADRSLEEAAMDLGGRPFRVAIDVTLPLIAPAMIAGWLLSFTLSLDDLVIASFVSGPGASTLPMVIFSKVKLGVAPDVNALATLIILMVGIGIVIAGFVMQQRERARISQRQALR
ncbi:MAG: ABC transporter permease subunit [Pseudomonadales bacterium]|nr:ABC transporter permease subunit [Pseudomonadales bacterium]|tara:strand:- start:4877 stop:5704 length:828 start_codon:yes stop_codon:yes gene_type:complete